jgi:molecular chaperone HscB
MNYFELFELPVSLLVDQNMLTERYLALQRKYAPGAFVNAGEDVQANALEKSRLVNKGFEILKNPDGIIQYILQMKGLLPENENYELAPDFLIETEEINSALRDADVLNIEEAKTKVLQLEKSLYHRVQHIIEGYSEDTVTEGQLLQVKDYFYRKKFLQGILDRLGGKRNIAG